MRQVKEHSSAMLLNCESLVFPHRIKGLTSNSCWTELSCLSSICQGTFGNSCWLPCLTFQTPQGWVVFCDPKGTRHPSGLTNVKCLTNSHHLLAGTIFYFDLIFTLIIYFLKCDPRGKVSKGGRLIPDLKTFTLLVATLWLEHNGLGKTGWIRIQGFKVR